MACISQWQPRVNHPNPQSITLSPQFGSFSFESFHIARLYTEFAAMSRSERILPIAIALFAPAISLLNGSLIADEEAFDRLFLNYFQGVIIVFGLWHLNRWLLARNRQASSAFVKYGSMVVANGLVIIPVSLATTAPVVEDVVGDYSSAFIAGRLVILVVIFNIIFRVLNEQKKNAELQVQNLSLKAENLKFQVDMLKQQINPHFLFNSLNTLLDLVESKSDHAVEYLQNFSVLYRNVLQSAKYDFITLEQELEFLDAYWNLLKVRFKEGIELQVDIDESKRGLLIPPLSLQFLIENAVKHNQVLASEPLQITIRQEGQELLVANPIKPKEFTAPSEKVGLINLQQRFSLLYQPINWKGENGQFIVQLPLKSPEHVH